MRVQYPQDARVVSTLLVEPYLITGIQPRDEASFTLVEEALRNAIREIESFSLVTTPRAGKDAEKTSQIWLEVQEIFNSGRKQRQLIEERMKL